jgi:hypothetical protein
LHFGVRCASIDSMAKKQVKRRNTNDQTPPKSETTGSALPPLSWVLSVPRGVRAELRIVGKEVTKGDLQRLKQQIDFLVESFEDGAD